MKRNATALLAALGAAALIAAPAAKADEAMAKKYNCLACHTVDKKVVGPAYKDVAKKYKGQADAEAKLIEKVKKGGSGVWGPIPMPPNTAVPDADVKALVEWILKQG
ncbi:MAG TPA: c-type cytochrome [Burkholderiales bacterium]|nr:c-type cytochrome [Burkholderiales bacterium]